MSVINSSQRYELFNSYPIAVQTAFESRKSEIFNDSKAWQLLLAMNLFAFGNVPQDTENMVTNQSDNDDAMWLKGVYYDGKSKPTAAGLRK